VSDELREVFRWEGSFKIVRSCEHQKGHVLLGYPFGFDPGHNFADLLAEATKTSASRPTPTDHVEIVVRVRPPKVT